MTAQKVQTETWRESCEVESCWAFDLLGVCARDAVLGMLGTCNQSHFAFMVAVAEQAVTPLETCLCCLQLSHL